MIKTVKPRTINFKDYPEFKPNLTPRQIFLLGSFGGTYWRPIYSQVTKKNHKEHHKNLPSSWWKDIPDHHLTTPFNKYDISINKYKKKVGTTLEFWEEKKWIRKQNPYGWMEWYCHFYNGVRTPDDKRQIDRWMGLASERGRFRKWLITKIINADSKYNDFNVSPAMRQTLQHWGYQLTKSDFDKEVKQRKAKK